MKFAGWLPVLVSVLVVNAAHAAVEKPDIPETTINVFVITEPGLSTSEIATEIGLLEEIFDQTQFSAGWGNAPATVTVINKWSPLVTNESFSGSGLTQWAQAALWVNIDPATGSEYGITIRNAMAADVIIAFVSNIEGGKPGTYSCGFTLQENWLGGDTSFVPTGIPPIDRRQRNREFGFLSVVSLHPDCTTGDGITTAGHEFGHIFGAGHYEDEDPAYPERGLYVDSRAGYFDIHTGYHIPVPPYWVPIDYRVVTIMGSDADSICLAGLECQFALKFSDEYFDWPGRKNSRAVDTTALSVAYYRSGDPVYGGIESCYDGMDNDGDGGTDTLDGDCQGGGTSELPPPPEPPPTCDHFTTPYFLYTYLVAECEIDTYGNTWTTYRAQWQHHCDSQVIAYEVWRQYSSTSAWEHGWDTLVPNTPIAVLNVTTARIKVRSCGPMGCSLFTAPSTYLPDRC